MKSLLKFSIRGREGNSIGDGGKHLKIHYVASTMMGSLHTLFQQRLPVLWIPFFYLRSPIQLLSCVQLFETPWTAACQASLSITNSRSLLKLMSIKLMMSFSHLILCCPSPSPPALNLAQHQGFSSESVLCIRWPKYWSFSFNNSPSNEYSRLISFRMDWLDLLAVQGTLKSLFQHHSSKVSML